MTTNDAAERRHHDRHGSNCQCMTTNDAAQRLRDLLQHLGYTKAERDLDEALAAERRATVERLAPWLVHPITCRGFVEPDAPCTCGLDAILDTETKR